MLRPMKYWKKQQEARKSRQTCEKCEERCRGIADPVAEAEAPVMVGNLRAICQVAESLCRIFGTGNRPIKSQNVYN